MIVEEKENIGVQNKKGFYHKTVKGKLIKVYNIDSEVINKIYKMNSFYLDMKVEV